MISSMRRLLLAVGFARLLVERLHQIEKWGIGLTRWKSHIDRKSTRLNSSHVSISCAVFCLKKKIGEAVAGVGGAARGNAARRSVPRPAAGDGLAGQQRCLPRAGEAGDVELPLFA